MIVLFIRHADDLNDKLTKRGKKQCEIMIDYDEQYKFSKIYTSPTKRCVDTAKALNKKFNIDVVIDKDLTERDQLGKAPETELEKLWYDNYLNPNFESEKPEGCKNYLDRNFRAFKRIINNHFDKNENAIIVAHSGTIYALSAFINGINSKDNIKWIRVGNCSKVYFDINEKV